MRWQIHEMEPAMGGTGHNKTGEKMQALIDDYKRRAAEVVVCFAFFARAAVPVLTIHSPIALSRHPGGLETARNGFVKRWT